MQLETILGPGFFRQRVRPFPHIVAEEVLQPARYQEVEEAFREALREGLVDTPEPGRFSRSVPGYGAYVKAFPPDLQGPLALFVSRPWHDMLAALWGIEATLDVDAALHHHPLGSTDGWVHNDLNPGWFVDHPRDDGVNIADPRRCSTRHGVVASPEDTPRPTVRAVAMLFFLANGPWSPGDGGETGLYSGPKSPVSSPAAVAPPINNTLVCFECTPFSYHAFLSNRRQPRNSVVLWLHTPRARAIARFGARSIEPWPSP